MLHVEPLFTRALPETNYPYLIQDSFFHNYATKSRSSFDCMHDLYNLDHYTIDSTLPLHSSLNWVFLWIDMHEFLMRESLVIWSSTEDSPVHQLTTRPLLVPPTIRTNLTVYNSVKLSYLITCQINSSRAPKI